jgi:hypothetical protein
MQGVRVTMTVVGIGQDDVLPPGGMTDATERETRGKSRKDAFAAGWYNYRCIALTSTTYHYMQIRNMRQLHFLSHKNHPRFFAPTISRSAKLPSFLLC